MLLASEAGEKAGARASGNGLLPYLAITLIIRNSLQLTALSGYCCDEDS